jgi:hypothetical protein
VLEDYRGRYLNVTANDAITVENAIRAAWTERYGRRARVHFARVLHFALVLVPVSLVLSLQRHTVNTPCIPQRRIFPRTTAESKKGLAAGRPRSLDGAYRDDDHASKARNYPTTDRASERSKDPMNECSPSNRTVLSLTRSTTPTTPSRCR